MKTKSKCPVCKAEFIKLHGNRLYCSEDCKKDQKAATQHKLYAILKEFRKGFLANYKLFLKHLPLSGTKKMTLWQLNGEGFRADCYYGSFLTEKKETLYRVGEYWFQIVLENQNHIVRITKK